VCDSEPLLINETLQDELNNCGDISLCLYSYTLENGTSDGGEELIISFADDITVK